MQRRNCSRLLPDEEGFPTSPLGSSFPSLPSRDSENGEILGDSMVALRRPPEESPRRLRLHSDLSRRRNQPGHYSLLNQHQQFSGFRIRDALAQKEGLRLRKGSMTYRRGATPLMQPQYPLCVQMKNGAPVGQSALLMEPGRFGELWGKVRFRPPFRVPRENFSESQISIPIRNPDQICVNIWEEFLLGTSVLKKNGKHIADEQTWLKDGIRRYLEWLLPKIIVDMLIYTIFFVLFFMSCLKYNMFWQLGGYILLRGHLLIHERAYENDVDLEFTGSIFQGPAYACVRSWCQHCIHKENAKVVNRLMKKMKFDILATKRT